MRPSGRSRSPTPPAATSSPAPGRAADRRRPPVLVAALESQSDPNTMNAALAGLRRVDAAPKGPEGPATCPAARPPRRAVARADAQRAGRAVDRRHAPPSPAPTSTTALVHWEAVYTESFPDRPAARPTPRLAENNYTLPQLVSDVVRPAWSQAGLARAGQAVLDAGQLPGLPQVRRRGRRPRPRPDDPLQPLPPRGDPRESIVDRRRRSSPTSTSRMTIATADGQVYNGMPAGGDDQHPRPPALRRHQGDDPQGRHRRAGRVHNLRHARRPLDPLSLQEIADLLALFEAQPKVEAPKPGQ